MAFDDLIIKVEVEHFTKSLFDSNDGEGTQAFNEEYTHTSLHTCRDCRKFGFGACTLLKPDYPSCRKFEPLEVENDS